MDSEKTVIDGDGDGEGDSDGDTDGDGDGFAEATIVSDGVGARGDFDGALELLMGVHAAVKTRTTNAKEQIALRIFLRTNSFTFHKQYFFSVILHCSTL